MRGLVVAAVAVASLLAAPAPAGAEVSSGCAAHLAAHPGESAAGDRRFHLARGEESPCSEADAGYSREVSSRDGERGEEGKSRFCRKRWYC